MAWRDLTPTQRIERLSRGLTKPKRHPPDQWKSRLSKARTRRDRIESERGDWQRLIEEFGGSVRQIAIRMGCDRRQARAAIWDLGLWPNVVRQRMANGPDAKWPTDRLVGTTRACQGNVMRISNVLGITRQCARRILVNRGLWPLVVQMREERRAA